MPIKPAEPMIAPPDLLDEGRPGSAIAPDDPGDPPIWWCLHTKPRQEKVTATFLRGKELAHFLPMASKVSRTPAGRKIRSIIPLFPGYVFLRGTGRDRLMAFQGSTLVDAIRPPDQDELVRDLRQIHRLLDSGLPVVPEPEYPAGARVRILDGPLQGIEGTVIRRGNREHFVSVVRFLGRGATVALEGWQIERIAG